MQPQSDPERCGNSPGILKADDVLNFLSKCPKEDLEAHPLSILVLMRCMFNWRKIQEMLKLKDFLIQVIERHTEISMEERGNS